MSWIHAWLGWWSGAKIPEEALVWGVTMRWWNRIGQLAQLAGACMVVFDIIGPERLRHGAEKVRARLPYRFLTVLTATFGVAFAVIFILFQFPDQILPVFHQIAADQDISLAKFDAVHRLYVIGLIALVLLCAASALFIAAFQSVRLSALVLELPYAAVLFRSVSLLLVICGTMFVLLAS